MVSLWNVTNKYGIDHTGFGFGGVFSDFDNDRDLDLYVINDFGNKATPNQLYRNEFPSEQLEEISNEKKVAFGINAMGTGVGDYNQDGLLDYFITNIAVSPFYGESGYFPCFLLSKLLVWEQHFTRSRLRVLEQWPP